jgi:hypothetical protein
MIVPSELYDRTHMKSTFIDNISNIIINTLRDQRCGPSIPICTENINHYMHINTSGSKLPFTVEKNITIRLSAKEIKFTIENVCLIMRQVFPDLIKSNFKISCSITESNTLILTVIRSVI